jgi:hypothetical protein
VNVISSPGIAPASGDTLYDATSGPATAAPTGGTVDDVDDVVTAVEAGSSPLVGGDSTVEVVAIGSAGSVASGSVVVTTGSVVSGPVVATGSVVVTTGSGGVGGTADPTDDADTGTVNTATVAANAIALFTSTPPPVEPTNDEAPFQDTTPGRRGRGRR